MRDKLIYQEKYKKGSMEIRDENLPVLKHTAPGSQVLEAELIEAGKILRKGQEIEYHVLKIYLNPTPKETD